MRANNSHVVAFNIIGFDVDISRMGFFIKPLVEVIPLTSLFPLPSLPLQPWAETLGWVSCVLVAIIFFAP